MEACPSREEYAHFRLLIYSAASSRNQINDGTAVELLPNTEALSAQERWIHMAKILIADDDQIIAEVLAFTLRRAGFEISLACDGLEALQKYVSEQPDLIILDLNLPRLDGLGVCSRVRAESSLPIIMLTASNAEDDMVAALEAGADDYITKPFSPRQLVARARAVLRRSGREPEGVLHVGALTLDAERHQAWWGDRPSIHLTPLETHLLRALMQNPNRVLSAESLIFRVWGPAGATRDMLKQLVDRNHPKRWLRVKLASEQPSDA